MNAIEALQNSSKSTDALVTKLLAQMEKEVKLSDDQDVRSSTPIFRLISHLECFATQF